MSVFKVCYLSIVETMKQKWNFFKNFNLIYKAWNFWRNLFFFLVHCFNVRNKKNCHINLKSHEIAIRKKVTEIYDIIEPFLNHFEYAIKMFLTLSLLNLSVDYKQQV